ncbi:MAG: tripartite tricarboxylate transporter receptor family protein [Noviherbaspirillum sp.]|nr:tripartite tricarboxylate transporter receptor family protein [Noviherbaspirillum sp.]MDB5795447.1 tripartite tricarboxylate transporter receptor family protein [Noviherbaspirillum sp.]
MGLCHANLRSRYAGILMAIASAVVTTFTVSNASAQAYPSKTIKIVVPYTPGTGYDSIARIVGPALAERLGVPVVVENMPGASGTIGAATVARAPADGATLLMIGEGTMASAYLYKKLSFNPLTDFAPITLAGNGTLMLVTNPQSGIKSAVNLIAKAKAEPNQLTFASPGVGTSQFLKMALFNDSAGIKMLHIPYKGSAGALNDLIGGVVTAALVPIHQAMPHVTGGKLVPLAIISPRRNAKAPDVPTLKEVGINGVDADMWYAFVAPKETPEAIVSRLNAELRSIIAQPDIKSGLEKTGLEVKTSTSSEMRAIMQNESDTVGQIIRNNNISAE